MSNATFIKEVLKTTDEVTFAEVKILIEHHLAALREFQSGGEKWRLVLAFTDLPQAICNAQKKVLHCSSNIV
jgi:hypothetical protein